jgi:hypothetical protein
MKTKIKQPEETKRPNDATRLLLDRIVMWEKDLSEYDSLESILREQFYIIDRDDIKGTPRPLHDEVVARINSFEQ